MGSEMGMKAKRSLLPGMLLLPAALLLVVCATAVAHAQQQSKPTPIPNGVIIDNGIIFVRVRDARGAPMKTEPSIALTTGGMGGPVIGVPDRMSGDEWEFQSLQVGMNYEVRVEAEGYQPEQKFVHLPAFDHATTVVEFRMQPTGSGGAIPPPGHFLLAPAAQKEVQQALKDLNSNKIDSAQKHLKNALKLAPGDAGVNYLMGLSYMRANQLGEASPYLEKAVSIDPKHVPALLALGTLHYRQGDYGEAVQVLKEAVVAAPDSWQAHWMLAGAYLSTKNYAQARHHAELALRAGKDKATRVNLILGDALERLGENAKARDAFEAFLKRNGNDREADAVRREVEKLKQLPATTAPTTAADTSAEENSGNVVLNADSGAAAVRTMSPPAGGSGGPERSKAESAAVASVRRATPAAKPAPVLAPPAPPVPPPPPPNWAPPDVDAEHPAIVSDAACPLSTILKRASRNAVVLVKDLQEFSAVEDYQSVEISRKENVGSPLERKFNYLVFIQRVGPRLITMDELRQPSLHQSNMEGRLMGMGSPALALVFHPYFQSDFDWQCEGLGEWKGERAWLLHFVQSPDRPTSPLHAFLAGADQYRVALKGRAWVGEKNGQVVHLETDMVKPMPRLELTREHFAIDYRLVRFRTHRVSLWLPEDVNLYIGYRRHYYHNYSHFSDFKLFWVGTGQEIAKPKQEKPKQ
jgi:tetratricopeptide (TPR) repeat protein